MDYSLLGKTPAFTPIDLQKIADEVMAELKPIIEEKEATVNFCRLPILYGTRSEIKLLFLNLVSNALKFQNKNIKPIVNVKATYNKSVWQFCISDNGIGIDDKYKNKIFMIFQRLNTNNNYQGHGIGLSHCKKIVESHGGQIWVESKLNEGSQFYFTLANTQNH